MLGTMNAWTGLSLLEQFANAAMLSAMIPALFRLRLHLRSSSVDATLKKDRATLVQWLARGMLSSDTRHVTQVSRSDGPRHRADGRGARARNAGGERPRDPASRHGRRLGRGAVERSVNFRPRKHASTANRQVSMTTAPASRPRLLVVAGPNGAGKTTITERGLAHEWFHDCEYINPDAIAQGLGRARAAILLGFERRLVARGGQLRDDSEAGAGRC